MVTGWPVLYLYTLYIDIFIHNFLNSSYFYRLQKLWQQKIQTKQEEINLNAEHDELLITQILNAELSELPCHPSVSTPKQNKTTPGTHPHFGGKQPKQHKPPKCLNVACKKSTIKLEEELQATQEKLQTALDELGNYM